MWYWCSTSSMWIKCWLTQENQGTKVSTLGGLYKVTKSNQMSKSYHLTKVAKNTELSEWTCPDLLGWLLDNVSKIISLPTFIMAFAWVVQILKIKLGIYPMNKHLSAKWHYIRLLQTCL